MIERMRAFASASCRIKARDSAAADSAPARSANASARACPSGSRAFNPRGETGRCAFKAR